MQLRKELGYFCYVKHVNIARIMTGAAVYGVAQSQTRLK